MEYLPVSISPRSLILDKNKNKNENCKLVYSGYIDEWACLKEFILSFKSSGRVASVVPTLNNSC